MQSQGRRAALPALCIAAVAAALFAAVIRPGGASMPVQPAMLLGLAVAYLIVALLVTRADAGGTIVVLSVMVGVHGVLAVVMGLAYDVFSPQPRGFPASFIFAVTGYLPGLLLQAAVGFLIAPMAADWYRGTEMLQRREKLGQMPRLREFDSFQQALDALCEVPEVAGAVVGDEGEVYGGGIWRSDPQSARHRTWHLLTNTGQTRQFFDLGDAGIMGVARHGRLVGVMVSDTNDAWLAEHAANKIFDAALYFVGPPK
ncbi:MAG: hypothetical protein R6V19_12750 [Armatimonadota bacterium]